MSETRVCSQRGCELPENALSGQCPQCLLAAGLEPPSKTNLSEQTGPSREHASGAFVPPTPEELANLIPQIEVLELLGKGGMGAVYKGRQKITRSPGGHQGSAAGHRP